MVICELPIQTREVKPTFLMSPISYMTFHYQGGINFCSLEAGSVTNMDIPVTALSCGDHHLKNWKHLTIATMKTYCFDHLIVYDTNLLLLWSKVTRTVQIGSFLHKLRQGNVTALAPLMGRLLLTMRGQTQSDEGQRGQVSKVPLREPACSMRLLRPDTHR